MPLCARHLWRLDFPSFAAPWLAAVWLAGCGSDTSSEADASAGSGSILVEVQITGDPRDSDGVAVAIDGIERGRIVDDGFEIFEGVTPEQHTVTLLDVSPLCRVEPEAMQTVQVMDIGRTIVRFELNCDFNRIVYQRGISADAELVTMADNGSEVRVLTDNDTPEFSPALSPDGTRVAFGSFDENGNSDIFVMNLDGSDRVNLTNDIAFDGEADWSPDATKIAFQSQRDGSADIWVYDLETGAFEQITDFDAADTSPDWSPDGERIVFSSFRSGDGAHIFIVGLDGEAPIQLTFGSGLLEQRPQFSPDGTQIVYESGNVGPADLFIIDADVSRTTAPLNLTGDDDSGVETSPTWSPDGQSIAYAANDDIHKIAVDGTTRVNLTNTSAETEREPHWGPSATSVVEPPGP